MSEDTPRYGGAPRRSGSSLRPDVRRGTAARAGDVRGRDRRAPHRGRRAEAAKDQIAFLINADLFACGVATLIQCLGFWKFGIKLPVIMGVTFAAVGPIVAMATAGTAVTTIFGSVIAAGIFTAGGALVRQAGALLSADRHRHDHRGDRHHAAARRHHVGRWRRRQQEFRRTGVPRHRHHRARRDPAAQQVRPRALSPTSPC